MQVYEDDDSVYIIQELCRGGELHHRINERHYSERTVGAGSQPTCALWRFVFEAQPWVLAVGRSSVCVYEVLCAHVCTCKHILWHAIVDTRSAGLRGDVCVRACMLVSMQCMDTWVCQRECLCMLGLVPAFPT